MAITSQDLADAYVAYGNENGFAVAECLLSEYLPKGMNEGKCYNVPQRKRPEFLRRLRAMELPEAFKRLAAK